RQGRQQLITSTGDRGHRNRSLLRIWEEGLRSHIEFIGVSRNCNNPAISRGYLDASCPSNREGLSGRPWVAPGCPFSFYGDYLSSRFGKIRFSIGKKQVLRSAQ